ncbi:MAG: Ig-like domain-containing protein [Vicinamibacteraceae bacterium]
MSGPSDAQPPAGPRPAARRPARPLGDRRPLLRWILLPAVLGSAAGIFVVVVPWGRYVLVFGLVVSGLAWLLRVAADWAVERVGPQRGVVLIGSVLFGTWLLMALNPPAPLRGVGFGPIRSAREPKDPYELPPAGSKGVIPSLRDPSEPIDPVQPFRDLVTPERTYRPAAPPTPPADGRRGTPRVSLRLSSSVSTFGEGLVLIAEVGGDGRPVHGPVAFVADGRVVDERTLRVQGVGSQIEFRLVGLAVGAHTLQVRYLGSRTFAAADSAVVEHRVAP